MSDRLVTPGIVSGDDRLDAALRPKTLDRYVGQQRIVDNLRVFVPPNSGGVKAAKSGDSTQECL